VLNYFEKTIKKGWAFFVISGLLNMATTRYYKTSNTERPFPMRKICKKQLPLPEEAPAHPKVEELAKISVILDKNSSIYTLVAQDLGIAKKATGSEGMSAEQVVKAAIIKQMEEYSYEELAFHLADSKSYRNFCLFKFGETYAKSTLNANIKAITADTWEAINRALIGYAETEDMEHGRKARIDCTVVETNIHTPTDSELLWDGVRVISRLLNRAKSELSGFQFSFMDHTRRSKRRRLAILNAKNSDQRKKEYKDLIRVAENTVGYAESAELALAGYIPPTFEQGVLSWAIKQELEHYLPLVRQIICQTTRRVIHGESVPADEKLVSLFEPHTDIIRKDRRDTYYGHKICLTGGASNLILDCQVLSGNPADATLTKTMLERQQEIFGRPPLKVALDGGFASKENLQVAKEMKIKDVCFSKGRGLAEEDMCRSSYVYKALRKFRAGIESGISRLKRAFGLGRCFWKGWASFNSYVWASIVSANLLTMARIKLATS
jgi:IS5 family transposase